MRKYGLNKLVATTPLVKASVETSVKSGFATAIQKISLTQLKVVVGNFSGTIPTGATVYLSSEVFKQPWSNKIYKLDNDDIILVPEEFILLVETPLPEGYLENEFTGEF